MAGLEEWSSPGSALSGARPGTEFGLSSLCGGSFTSSGLRPETPRGRFAGTPKAPLRARAARTCAPARSGAGHRAPASDRAGVWGGAPPSKVRRRGTISRILFPARRPKAPNQATTIPLAPPSLAGSSDLPGGFGRAVLMTPPYLVLLRAGFSLPSALRRTRCALTAPFHPYPSTHRAGGPVHSGQARRPVSSFVERRYVFCATFLQVALTGDYPAHCPLEFGLSSPRDATA